MNQCRYCKCDFEATTWQVSKSDYECPTCRKIRQAAYRVERKAKGSPVVSGKMPIEYHRAYEIDYFKDPKNRKRRNERMRGYAHQHKERVAARRALRTAIESGIVKRFPCEVCGEQKTEGHHVAYDLPLEVTWLCKPHHSQLHIEAKATGQTP